MKKFLITLVILVSLFSCQSVHKIERNCNVPNYISGKLIYAIPTHRTRAVVLDTQNGKVMIYNVPLDVDLNNIPTCYKGNHIVYFYPQK